MEPTIPYGSRLLVERGAAVRRGDLVAFPIPAAGLRGLVVERLIGLPGDRVACCDARGRVILIARTGSFLFTPVRTPHTFVAGGLAPPDQRPLWPAGTLATASAGLCALVALTVFGLVRLVLRSQAGRRPA